MGKRFYTVAQLAEELGMAPRTIREALSRGDLKGRKLGNRWIVSADFLEEFLKGGGNDGE